jgi:hypothetical protein
MDETTVVVGDMQLAGVDVMPGPGPPVVDITQLNILSECWEGVSESLAARRSQGDERRREKNCEYPPLLFAGLRSQAPVIGSKCESAGRRRSRS